MMFISYWEQGEGWVLQKKTKDWRLHEFHMYQLLMQNFGRGRMTCIILRIYYVHASPCKDPFPMCLVVSSVKREISSSWLSCSALSEIYMNEIINKLKPRKGGEINRGSSIRRQAGQGEGERMPASHAIQGSPLRL